MKIIGFSVKNASPCVLYKVLFLAGMFLATCITQAAGLGKLTVSSYLGQPLKAEIALESVTGKEADTLTAKLASPRIFQKAGINLAPYHATLSVAVEKRTGGQPYIRVTSPQAINEPFLKLLIELHSSSGRMLREYNVLLDPADTRKPAGAAPIVQSAANESSESASADASKETQPSAKAERQPPASRVKPVTRNGDTYGPVMHGDTLSRIARQVSPDGVSLNQMLIALYRANRDAFLEKNMNLLKTGVILHIPEEGEITSVTTKEASREITVQKENWDSYRQKIAELAGGAPGRDKLEQSQSGKITTVTEGSSIAGAEKSDEVLILSKGELLDDNHASGKHADNKTAQNYLHMMEEDAIAKERALHEANERVAILEQNVAKLQRLLELKGEAAENKTRPESAEARPAPGLQPVPVVAEQTETAESTAHIPEKSALPITIPVQPVGPASPLKSAQPANPEMEEPALIDTLLGFVTENTEWVAGGVASLLVLMLGISVIRRRKMQADDTDTENNVYDYDDKGSSSAESVITGVTSSDLSDVIENGQTTHSAAQEHFNSTDSHTNIDPEVFFSGKQDETIAESFFPDPDSDNQILQGDNSVFNELDHEIKISTAEPDQTKYESDIAEPEKYGQYTNADIGEQWVFTVPDISREGETGSTQIQSAVESAIPHGEHHIDFDLNLPDDAGSVQKHSVVNELSDISASLANIDLNLGDEAGVKFQPVKEHSEAEEMQWREVATKLDLAKAYLEMDDAEGAREILEEILREGDDGQRSTAHSMLEKIS